MKTAWIAAVLALGVGVTMPAWAKAPAPMASPLLVTADDDEQLDPKEVQDSFILDYSYLDYALKHPGDSPAGEMDHYLGCLKQAWEQAKSLKLDTAHLMFKPVHVVGESLDSAEPIPGAQELTFDQAYGHLAEFEKGVQAAEAADDAERASTRAKWEKELTGDRLRIFKTEGYPERFNGNTMTEDDSDAGLAKALKAAKWQYTKGSGGLLYHIYYLFDGDTLVDTQRAVVDTP